MKLESPLSNLIERCQTVCVPECCGVQAYDFSPIHIASYLIMWKGAPDENEVEKLLSQLATLKIRARRNGLTIDEMNQIFTADKINELVEEITTNMGVALDLIKQTDALRAHPTAFTLI